MIDAPVLQTAEFRSPRGERLFMLARAGTSDGPVLETILGADEYRLAGLHLEGWAIDVGAHVGGVTVALLADNPNLRVIAVEPVDSSADVLEMNCAPWADRLTLIRGAVGDEPLGLAYGGIEDLPASYRESNRFIAGIKRGDAAPAIEAPRWTLARLLEEHGVDEVALLKIDCEGGEWEFLADPAANARLALIRGEYHDDPALGHTMVALLRPTHNVTLLSPGRVVGLFEAVRR